MNIKLLYFGRPRDNLKASSETIVLPAGIATVAELLAWLGARGPTWAAELAPQRVRCAVNQELGALSVALRDGDEVAIFSPISGG